jgi:hypothetical protein
MLFLHETIDGISVTTEVGIVVSSQKRRCLFDSSLSKNVWFSSSAHLDAAFMCMVTPSRMSEDDEQTRIYAD